MEARGLGLPVEERAISVEQLHERVGGVLHRHHHRGPPTVRIDGEPVGLREGWGPSPGVSRRPSLSRVQAETGVDALAGVSWTFLLLVQRHSGSVAQVTGIPGRRPQRPGVPPPPHSKDLLSPIPVGVLGRPRWPPGICPSRARFRSRRAPRPTWPMSTWFGDFLQWRSP